MEFSSAFSMVHRLHTKCRLTATRNRSPGVSSAAFCAQSPDLRFAPLMDTDFAVSCPLVRHWRLISGFCPSTRTFVLRFFQTPPRGDSPCVLTRPSPPSGWPEDFHLQAAEHAQHTTKPLARQTLRVSQPAALVKNREFTQIHANQSSWTTRFHSTRGRRKLISKARCSPEAFR